MTNSTKKVYVVYQVIDHEQVEVAICKTQSSARLYCIKQLHPNFSNSKDGSTYVSAPSTSYYIRERELLE